MSAAAVTAIAAPRGAAMVVGALAGGYALGALPVAWLLVRRARRRRGVPPGGGALASGRGGRVRRVPPGGMLTAGESRPLGTADVLAAGVGAAVTAVALELLRGAVAGLGARLYDATPWFTACAIAGCVVGDTFPPPVRRGGRGILPLASGVFFALPGTWAAGFIVALPAVLVLALSGAGLEAVLAVSVPAAFVLGTSDLRTVPPALLIVAALAGRGHLRRQARHRARAQTGVPDVETVDVFGGIGLPPEPTSNRRPRQGRPS